MEKHLVTYLVRWISVLDGLHRYEYEERPIKWNKKIKYSSKYANKRAPYKIIIY